MGINFLRGDDNNVAENTATNSSTENSHGFSFIDLLHEEHSQSECTTSSKPGDDSTKLGSVNENNFSKLALSSFDQIDTDKDGLLSKNELKEALNGQSKLPCDSAEAARIMLKDFDVVKSLEGFDASPVKHSERDQPQTGISKDDLRKFDKIRQGDGFFAGYAKDSIERTALGTATLLAVPASMGGAGAGATLIGEGFVGIGIGMTGGLAIAAAVGAGIGLGMNYYSYKHYHAPKIKTFLDDINAGDALRSRV